MYTPGTFESQSAVVDLDKGCWATIKMHHCDAIVFSLQSPLMVTDKHDDKDKLCD